MAIRRFIALLALTAGLTGGLLLQASENVRDPRLDEAEQIYRQQGPAQARPQFERLLQVFAQQNDRYNLALAEGFLGAVHWRLGNFNDAAAHLDTALSLKRELGDRLEEGKTLNVMGLLQWDLGHFDLAIEQFKKAAALGLSTDDAKLQGAALNNLSLVYDELGAYDTSLEQYRKVLKIYRDADFPRGMSDTLGNIGGVYLLLGQFLKAEEYYQQALQISEKLESVTSMTQDHGNLGLAYTGLGRTDEALAHFDRALALAENAGMRQEQAVWHRGKANVLIKAGRYDLALEHHRAALDLYAEVDAKALLLDALHDMGQLQLELGDPTSAERYFQQAIELGRAIGAAKAITTNLIALGDLQYRHEQYDAALALYYQAVQRARGAGELVPQAAGLLRVATIHLDQQEFGTAEEEVLGALEIAKDTGARPTEAEALLMHADLARLSGEPAKALDRYRLAQTLASELGNPDVSWRLHYGKALALNEAGQKEAAVESLLTAARLIESVRNRLREKRYRAGYLQDKHDVYISLVRLQLELGRTGDAFDSAERLRYWSDIESPGDWTAPPSGESSHMAETELRERIRQLQSNLEAEQSLLPPDRRQLAIQAFSRELLLAEQQYQSLLDDRSVATPVPATPHRHDWSTALQEQLGPEDALVEYVVGPDSIMIFLLTASELRAESVKAHRPDLRSRLELLRDLLKQRDNDFWQFPAASLSETVLAPMLQNGWLDGKAHLYLVPHDMLHYLPFAVLPVDGPQGPVPLIERFTLAYLPAGSLLAYEYRPADSRPQSSLLALAPGNSRLQNAPEEARSIAQLFRPNGHVLLGGAATESAFKQSADRHQVLHLATHGYFNKLNPLLSGLQLEPDQDNDGLLEVHEILEMRLTSNLVTLSACETGMGSGFFTEIPAGDDFVSLTRAFLSAGSQSVLATLWEVNDRSTVELMEGFYGRLSTGDGFFEEASALAEAQRILSQSKEYGHPYFWAPFVLVGQRGRTRTAPQLAERGPQS